MKVSIEEVQALLAHKNAYNSLKFDEIEWTLNGQVVPISQEKAESFKFMGLNNTDFVDLGLCDPMITGREDF